MSIPYIREVKYTDDGCTEFDCLCCGKGFELRGYVYRHVDNGNGLFVKELTWKICPFCGTKFEGLIESKPKEYFDTPWVREKPIILCDYGLYSKMIDESGYDYDWDWEATGDRFWIARKLKECKVNYTKEKCGYSFIFKIVKK